MMASATRGTFNVEVSVADEYGARHFVAEEITGVRQNHRDAGAYVVAADQRSVPHADSRDIGDRVQRAARQRTAGQTDLRRARTARRFLRYCRH